MNKNGQGNVLISVIIPTRHRNEHLALCLERLNSEIQCFNDYEIIVSDDGRKTTAKNLIKQNYPWVRWIKGPASGPAANRNHGAKYANGEWIAFIDDDCLPVAGWISGYVKAIEHHHKKNVFEGRTVVDRKKERCNEVAPVNKTGGYLWSCNLAVRKSYFEELGGYCEDFKFELEDIEFRTRIIKDGQELIFVPEAEVCHPWRKIDSNYKVSTESLLIFLKKHPDQRKYFSMITRLKIILPQSLMIIPDFFRYRGKGFIYAIKHTFYEMKNSFYIPYRLWLTDHKKKRHSNQIENSI